MIDKYCLIWIIFVIFSFLKPFHLLQMPVPLKHLYQRLNVLFPTDEDVNDCIARLKAKRPLPERFGRNEFHLGSDGELHWQMRGKDAPDRCSTIASAGCPETRLGWWVGLARNVRRILV
jgi:hypothetical protein